MLLKPQRPKGFVIGRIATLLMVIGLTFILIKAEPVEAQELDSGADQSPKEESIRATSGKRTKSMQGLVIGKKRRKDRRFFSGFNTDSYADINSGGQSNGVKNVKPFAQNDRPFERGGRGAKKRSAQKVRYGSVDTGEYVIPVGIDRDNPASASETRPAVGSLGITEANQVEHVSSVEPVFMSIEEDNYNFKGINVTSVDSVYRVEPFFIQTANLFIKKESPFFDILPSSMQEDIVNGRDVLVVFDFDDIYVPRASYLETPPLKHVVLSDPVVIKGAGSKWGFIKAVVDYPSVLPPGTSSSSSMEKQDKYGVYGSMVLDNFDSKVIICTKSGCITYKFNAGSSYWNQETQKIETNATIQNTLLTDKEIEILKKYYASLQKGS